MSLRRSAEVARGVSLALADGPIPLEWFEAVCAAPEEAKRMQAEVNAARQFARAKAKLGWPA